MAWTPLGPWGCSGGHASSPVSRCHLCNLGGKTGMLWSWDHVLGWRTKGKASSGRIWGPSLVSQAYPCREKRREENTFYISLGYLPSIPGCSWSLAIKNRQNPLVILQNLILSPLGGAFTCEKVPGHAGEMLRFNKGRPVRFGAGSFPQAW